MHVHSAFGHLIHAVSFKFLNFVGHQIPAKTLNIQTVGSCPNLLVQMESISVSCQNN